MSSFRPYRSTLWPFRRLVTYPSYPYRVGRPCPRTLSKFSGLATYPLGPRRGTSLRNLHFLPEMAPWRVQTSFLSISAPWVPPSEPEGPPKLPRRGPWVPPGQGARRAPWGALGPEALRAGGPGKHGLAITRSALERHGLSKGCGLAVPGEAVRGYPIARLDDLLSYKRLTEFSVRQQK